MKKYCKYCGKQTYSDFCNTECMDCYNEYLAFAEKYKVHFLLGVFLTMALFLFPIFFGHIDCLQEQRSLWSV